MEPAPKRNLLNVPAYDAGNAVPRQSLAELEQTAESDTRQPRIGQHLLMVRFCDLLHGFEFHKNGYSPRQGLHETLRRTGCREARWGWEPAVPRADPEPPNPAQEPLRTLCPRARDPSLDEAPPRNPQ